MDWEVLKVTREGMAAWRRDWLSGSTCLRRAPHSIVRSTIPSRLGVRVIGARTPGDGEAMLVLHMH